MIGLNQGILVNLFVNFDPLSFCWVTCLVTSCKVERRNPSVERRRAFS